MYWPHHRQIFNKSLSHLKGVLWSLFRVGIYSGLLFVPHIARAEYDQLQQFLSTTNQLQANFTQTVRDRNGRILEQATGELFLQRPGQFYLYYKAPYIQKIVSDGYVLWVYDMDLQQVTISTILATTEQTPMAVLSGDDKLEKHFILSSFRGSNDELWYRLVPKHEETTTAQIQIHIGSQKIILVTESLLGQTTYLTLLDINKTPETIPSFKLQIPAEVDILDNRQR